MLNVVFNTEKYTIYLHVDFFSFSALRSKLVGICTNNISSHLQNEAFYIHGWQHKGAMST